MDHVAEKVVAASPHAIGDAQVNSTCKWQSRNDQANKGLTGKDVLDSLPSVGSFLERLHDPQPSLGGSHMRSARTRAAARARAWAVWARPIPAARKRAAARARPSPAARTRAAARARRGREDVNLCGRM